MQKINFKKISVSRLFVFIILFIYAFVSLTSSAGAFSKEQKSLYEKGIYFYDQGSERCDFGYKTGSINPGTVGEIKGVYSSGITGTYILEMFAIHLLKRLAQINNKPESDYLTQEHVIALLAFARGEGGDIANSSVFNPMNGGMDPKSMLGLDAGSIWGGDGIDGRRAYPSFDIGVEIYARQFSIGNQSRLNYILSNPTSTAEDFINTLTFFDQYDGNKIWAAASLNSAAYLKKELSFLSTVRKNYTDTAGLVIGTSQLEQYDRIFRKDLITYKDISGNLNNGSTQAIGEASTGGCSCSTSSGSSSVATDSIVSILQVLAKHESGGDPTAKNPNGSASGKYQYTNGTWQGASKAYGPAKDYVSASDAPENIQDAVAYIAYAKKYKQYNGDIFKMIVSHYLPAANDKPDLLDKVPSGGNTQTPREFADQLMGWIATGEAKNIQLNYATAPDLSTWLEKGDVADIASTSSASNTGNCTRSLTTNGEFIFYSQNNSEWGSLSVPGIAETTIEGDGCGLTSYSMIAATLKQDPNINPKTFRQQLLDKNLSIAGYVGQQSAIAGKDIYGLSYDILDPNNRESIRTALESGKLIVSGGAFGPYRYKKHIVVLKSIDPDGTVHVADPEDNKLVDRTYPLDDFISNGNYFTAVSP